VEAVHARGLKLGVWTVNESELARRSAAAGVDAITTDTPGWIRQRLAVK
jgi:glycerophosphoryl diester phosphodiesterase